MYKHFILLFKPQFFSKEQLARKFYSLFIKFFEVNNG